MKRLLFTAAMVLAATTAQAQQQPAPQELSAPIVALTGVLAKNADTLSLDDAQRADLKAWVDTMPAKRKALEAEARAARAALREAILTGAPQGEREALAQEVGQLETRLVLMRSNCTDHWRTVLSEDQFAQLVALAGY